MSKRAVIYCRVSSDNQRNNYSIPSQVDACLKYAKERGYLVIGNQFVDPITGLDVFQEEGALPAFVDDYTSLEISRPSLDAAFGFLQEVGFDVLICYCVDRLSRDPYIRQTIERELARSDVAVEYVLGNYEDSAEGEVRKDLDATFAKWENAKRQERFTRGKRRKAEMGLFVAGRAPYGYRRDPSAFGGLAVHEKEAEIVRRVFNLYTEEGLSINAIARTLTEDPGVFTHLGNKEWRDSTIKTMLRNTVYAGWCYYNKWGPPKTGKKKQVLKDRSEWIKIPTTPIIDKSTYDATQRLMAFNRDHRRKYPSRFYLLRSMVFCAECERLYNGCSGLSQTSEVAAYRYYRHRVRQGHCSNSQVPAASLEQYVWAEIAQVLQDPAHLRKGYEEAAKQHEATRARTRQHLEVLERNAIRYREQLHNLLQAYIDPDIGLTKKDYSAQKTRIENELQEVEVKIASLQEELSQHSTPADLETLEAFLEEIKTVTVSIGDEPSPEVKRRVLELLNVQVIIHKTGEVHVEGWFRPKEMEVLDTVSRDYAGQTPAARPETARRGGPG